MQIRLATTADAAALSALMRELGYNAPAEQTAATVARLGYTKTA